MVWCLPTYDRPESFRNLMEHLLKFPPSTRGIVVVQGTDKEKEYLQWSSLMPPTWGLEVLPENIGFCGALNKVFKQFPDEPWYGVLGDDEYVYTKDWDLKLIKAAENKYISYGTDKDIKNGRIHTYNVVGGDLMRAVGYWAPEGLWHWYFDDVWEFLANACGLRRPVEDVITEHRHYLYGKAPKDRTYIASESRAMLDQKIFNDWKEEEFFAAIERIKLIKGK